MEKDPGVSGELRKEGTGLDFPGKGSWRCRRAQKGGSRAGFSWKMNPGVSGKLRREGPGLDFPGKIDPRVSGELRMEELPITCWCFFPV